MKVAVIQKMNVKLVLDVQAVQPILDSVQIYIVAHKEELVMEEHIFVQLEFLVEKMKEIVMLIMSVKMVLDVRAVQPILDSVQIYIVARKEELTMEDGTFAQVVILVALMKVTVTIIGNARRGYYVVLTTVLLLLDFHHQ